MLAIFGGMCQLGIILKKWIASSIKDELIWRSCAAQLMISVSKSLNWFQFEIWKLFWAFTFIGNEKIFFPGKNWHSYHQHFSSREWWIDECTCFLPWDKQQTACLFWLTIVSRQKHQIQRAVSDNILTEPTSWVMETESGVITNATWAWPLTRHSASRPPVSESEAKLTRPICWLGSGVKIVSVHSNIVSCSEVSLFLR